MLVVIHVLVISYLVYHYVVETVRTKIAALDKDEDGWVRSLHSTVWHALLRPSEMKGE